MPIPNDSSPPTCLDSTKCCNSFPAFVAAILETNLAMAAFLLISFCAALAYRMLGLILDIMENPIFSAVLRSSECILLCASLMYVHTSVLRLSVFQFRPFHTSDFSSEFQAMIVVQVIISTCLYHLSFDEDDAPTVLDARTIVWDKMLSRIFWSPIQEEVFFRLLLGSIWLNRFSSRWSLVVPNVVFGLFHYLFNRDTHSSTYVLVQSILGIEIGFFYSVHLIHTHSWVEIMALHGLNNLGASVLGLSPDIIETDLTRATCYVPCTLMSFHFIG